MHLLIPFAACADQASRTVLRQLPLPNLQKLLRRMVPQPVLRQPGMHPQLPHEHILAQALGLPVDPSIPWAAHRAAELGHDSRNRAWAFITPCHWQLGQAQVTLLDPAWLALQETESRALLAAMQPYFQEDGITLIYERAGRWLAQGELFRGLSSASLERVISQDVAPWMPSSATLRRLQNEMQMLLYAHAVNDERDSRRALAVNSFWVSGSGALEAVSAAPQKLPVVLDALTPPAMQQDWQAWALAWQALDAREIAALLAELDGGNASVRLSLCSEDRSLDLIPAPRGLWQSLAGLIKPPTLASVWKQL
jgi:hypothetical protein